jgi:predicted nucleic acid-binding protein
LRLKAELDSSLLLFKREHSRAIKLLYRTLPAETVYSAEELAEDIREDPFADTRRQDDEGAGVNDNLFRIYHLYATLSIASSPLLH